MATSFEPKMRFRARLFWQFSHSELYHTGLLEEHQTDQSCKSLSLDGQPPYRSCDL